MKKMAFLLAMILVVAVSVAPAYAAEDTTSVPTVNADKSGKFTVEETGLTAGEWYGMLVLESGVAPSATLDASKILYIDQVKADTNGVIAFEGFGLLGGATAGDVYIGGKGLTTAKNIATLAAYEAPVLTGINLDKTAANAKKGETVELTATFVPAGAEGTLTWVSSDDTIAKVAADTTDLTKATVTVSGEAAKDAKATITAFIDSDADGIYTSADTIFASCEITVVEVVTPAFAIGDVNHSGVVDGRDERDLARHLAEWPGYAEGEGIVFLDVADVNNSGVVDGRDERDLARHLAEWPGYETLPIE